jgi:hypothetical protein
MDRYGGPQTAITIAVVGGLYFPIIMELFGGPQTTLTIALLGGL